MTLKFSAVPIIEFVEWDQETRAGHPAGVALTDLTLGVDQRSRRQLLNHLRPRPENCLAPD